MVVDFCSFPWLFWLGWFAWVLFRSRFWAWSLGQISCQRTVPATSIEQHTLGQWPLGVWLFPLYPPLLFWVARALVAFGCVGFCGCWLGVVFALPAPLLFPLSPRLGCLLPFLSCKSWALPRPVAAGSPILSHSLTSLCRSPSSYPDVNLCLLPVFAGSCVLLALVMAPH